MEFKVGDWVRIKDTSMIFKIDFIDKYSNCHDSDNEYANTKHLEIWTLYEGEWC